MYNYFITNQALIIVSGMTQFDQMTIDFFHNLSEASQSYQPISLQLVQKLDNFTQIFLASNDSSYVQACCEAWLLIQKSQKFWQNAQIIITNSTNQQTILQILVKMHQRIKINWVYEDNQVRSFIKNLICNLAKQYPMLCEPGNQKYKIQFRKINSIIVEILKYEWNNDWQNFLFDICTAMLNQNNLAENYFDLISVTFQEFFHSNNLLTSNQRDAFKSNINNQCRFLFETFETFLKTSSPEPLLKNCLEAFESMIPILSPASIYLNFSFNKILQLLGIRGLQIPIVNCILAFCKLNYEECDKIIKTKLLMHKQNILMELLKETQSESLNPFLLRKITEIASNVIASLEYQIQNEKQEQQKQLVDNNVFISSILSQAIIHIPNQDIEVKVLSFLAKYAKFYHYKPLVRKLIDLTSCPLDNQFFSRQKIFASSDEYQSDNSENINLKELEPIFRKLINLNEKQYLEYLIEQIEKNITNMDQLRHFCRICWNFHSYLNYATMISEKFLIFTNKICQIEERTQKYAQTNHKMFIFKAKIMGCCRANLLLILSHQNSLKGHDLTQIFIVFSIKTMMQSDTLVQFNLQVLKRRSKYLNGQQISQILQSHLQAVKNRSNRNKLDQLFLNFICSWVSQNNNQEKQANQIITNIFMPYRMKLNQIKQKKAKAKVQFNGLKCNLIETSVKLLTLYTIVLKQYPKNICHNSQLLNQLIFLLMLRATCQDIKQIDKISDFKKSNYQVQKLLLKLLPQLLISQNAQIGAKIFEVIINNINLEFKEICDETIDNTLDLVICFIRFMDKSNGFLTEQTKIVFNFVNQVNQICFDTLRTKHLDFIIALVVSQYFSLISQECGSRIIYEIFDFCRSEKQEHIQKSHYILSHVLTNAIEKIRNGGQKFSVEKIIIHLNCNLFKTIIKKDFSNNFINEYCDLLCLSIQVTKNIKKFHILQTNDNIEEIKIQFAEIIRHEYHYLKNQFLVEIINYLEKVLHTTTTSGFCVCFQDFLVQLKRGFIGY